MSSDLQLRQDVLDELEFEPSVNAAHIGVTANHGVVTLTGFVTSYAEKTMAERAARRVKGVKAIAEEIEVRLPSDTKRADDEIAARAIDILKWQVGVLADRIKVKVEKGVVTLTGDVDWQFQKTEADHVVHKLNDSGRFADPCRRDQREDREGVAAQCRARGIADHRRDRGRQGDPEGQGPRLVRARHRRTGRVVGPWCHRGSRSLNDRTVVVYR